MIQTQRAFATFCLLFTITTAVDAKSHKRHQELVTSTDEKHTIVQFKKLIDQKQFAKANHLLPKLKQESHSLYANYLWLEAQPSKEKIPELIAYVMANPVGGWTDKLKETWAAFLAKENEWQILRQNAWLFDKEDARCWALQAQLKTNNQPDDDWYEEVKNDWQRHLGASSACAPNHHRLLTSNYLSIEDWQLKIQTALSQNKAARLQDWIKYMPKTLAENTESLLNELKQPEESIKKLLTVEHKESQHTQRLMQLMRQLNLQNPDLTYSLWQQAKTAFEIHPLISDPFERTLFLALAKKHKEQDVEWLLNIPALQHDETSLTPIFNKAWQESDWILLLKALDMLPQHLQNEDRWQYWRARAIQQTQDTTTANPVWEALSEKRSFYGFLAADQLGKPYQLNAEKLAGRSIEQLTTSPLLNQIQALYQAGLKDIAWKEWRYRQQKGLVALNEIPAYAHHALTWGWPSFSVLSMGNPQHWNYLDLRFPMPFYDLLSEQSQQNQIALAWAFGITRRESAYNPDVTSKSGAMGLMQLMPKTAKALMPIKNKQEVYQPTLNVQLGTKLLGQLSKEFNQNIVLATASYNAGGFRVRQWLKNYPNLPTDQWIELIPFKETRDYVKAVLEYMIVFERLGNLPQTQMVTYLQPVQVNKIEEKTCDPDKEWCL